MKWEGRTLSINKIPDFPALDMFVGGRSGPYPGFGGVIERPGPLLEELRSDAASVREDLRKIFHVAFENPASTTQELDRIIEDMWETGWDPQVNDLNLFTREFGLLLFDATLDLLGGSATFRDPGEGKVYVHTSIFWPGVEAFPFHKAFKCMTQSDGESMAHFIRGVANVLVEQGVISSEMRDRIPRVS